MLTQWDRVKRRLVGRPLASAQQDEQLLPKTLALPVFSSDPLSSVAYATEEIMLVLALAGVAAFSRVIPISIAIALLLAVVITSYRQTVRAYPEGGGAFLVTRDNLGLGPAKVAASALLTDYVLTVAVSVAAGVAAITSAAPGLLPWRVHLAVGFVVLVTVANLRGVKESSTLFAMPTYAFVTTVGIMLLTGLYRCLGTCPQAPSSNLTISSELGLLSLFLVLRAFASGSTALTGIEAIADGVPAFRPPQSRNAATTLAIMGAMSITMFLGIGILSRLFDVRISEETIDEFGTVISQVGRTAFGGGFMFYVLQVTTAGILILAANTAYQDFPRLSAILARNMLMPRQLRNRGDRLVYSNGIVILALLAILLLVVFQAQVSRLIQLYVVGVFTSFTLSQTSMVRRWLTTREPGWKHSILPNALGAAVTGFVLVIVSVVKFVHGAWIVLVAIPAFVWMMSTIRKHYLAVADQLRVQELRLPSVEHHRVVVLVSHTGQTTRRAIRYAELLAPESFQVAHVREPGDDDLLDTWDELYPDHPLTVVPGSGGLVRRVRLYLREERRGHPDGFLTVVIPETLRKRHWTEFLQRRHGFLIKAGLLFEPGLVVTDLTHQPRRYRTRVSIPDQEIERHVAVIVAGDVTQPTLQAVAYARAIHAQEVRAIHIDIDEEQTARVEREWEAAAVHPHLEIVDSPYREVTGPLVRYVRRLRHDTPEHTIVSVIIPEFIVPTWRGQILHNQTGLAIKAALVFEPHVAVTSVPWHLQPAHHPARV